MRRILLSLLVLAIPFPVLASMRAPSAAGAEASAPAPAASAAAACSIVGDWVGTYPPGPYPFSGTEIRFSFRADGTGQSKSARADSPIAWHMDGAALSFHGTESGTARFSCRKEDEGKYSLTYAGDCGKVTFGLVSDPCAGRAKTADGMALNRNK
jgi:hypothetical protein